MSTSNTPAPVPEVQLPVFQFEIPAVPAAPTESIDGALRDWQRRCFGELRDSHHWIVKAPMASGKSFLICAMSADWLRRDPTSKVVIAVPQTMIAAGFRKNTIELPSGERVEWVLHASNDLCTESPKSSVKHLVSFLNEDAAQSVMGRVVLCTHATLARAFGIDPKAFQHILVVIDEAHHVKHGHGDETENKLGALVKFALTADSVRIGLTTATFFRGDKSAIVPDLSKFTKFELEWEEFFKSLKHLRSFSKDFMIGADFLLGLDRLFAERIGKTIVYIPPVNSRYSSGSKGADAQAVINAIAGTQNPIVRDADGPVMSVKRNDGWVRVVNLVDHRNREAKKKLIDAAHESEDPDAIDVIIALGIFKEGANWRYADREIIIGQRGSLTEIVQMFGRMLRDAPGKTHVETFQLMPLAFDQADEAAFRDDLNDHMKELLVAMLEWNEFVPVPTELRTRRENGTPDSMRKGNILKLAIPDHCVQQEVVSECFYGALDALIGDMEDFRDPFAKIVSKVLTAHGITDFHDDITDHLLRMFSRQSLDQYGMNIDAVDLDLIDKNPFGSVLRYVSAVCDVSTFKQLRAAARSTTPFMTYAEAKAYMKPLGITSTDFPKWKDRPADIPSNPNVAYKDSGWISWGEFLGSKNFKTYDEAKAYLKPFGFSAAIFLRWKDRPADIPSNPQATYKGSGWISWGHFLGTGSVSPSKRNFKTHEEAKEYMKPLGLTLDNFRTWKGRPTEIPSNPNVVYKDNGWISFDDFLGIKKVKTYEEAKTYMKPFGLSARGFKKWKDRPADIPSNPPSTYRESGWVSWVDFLGTGCKPHLQRKKGES